MLRRAHLDCSGRGLGGQDHRLLFRFDNALALSHLTDFLECRLDVAFREAYLPKSFDVAESFAPFLQHDDGTCEAKAALEQSSLVNHVHSSAYLTVMLFILPGHDEEGDSRRVQHLR
jgi:hypothetical protein